jgi:Biotin-lipoyl like
MFSTGALVDRTPAGCALDCAEIKHTTAAGGYLYWDYAEHFETTDDAFIAARQFAIAPKVPVTDNQHVPVGGVIARIDERDYRIALEQAQAQVASAEANIQNIDAQVSVQNAQPAPTRHRRTKRRRRWCSPSSRRCATSGWTKRVRAPCPSALRYLTVLRIGIHDADLDHDRFPAFHFDGVTKPYFAGSSLILSAPFATGIIQIGVATSAELRSDV